MSGSDIATDQALAGKAVVVTGAGRGIGAATARHLAALGARVIVNDIDLAEAEQVAQDIRAQGGDARPDGSDVRLSAQAEKLIGHCVEAFGRIDGLVNNAALFHVDRLEDADPEAFAGLLTTNVLGVFNCAQHAIRRMYAQGFGAVVNITSGAQAGIPMMTAYAASKGAVSSMTYTWALEAAGTGVRVNAVSPMAATRMAEVMGRHAKNNRAPRPPSPPPEVNAPIIAFLLSDLSRSLNGQVVRIDRDSLSLMSHPAICAPVYQAAGWTLAAVAEVFAHDLAQRQQPPGIAAIQATPVTLEDARRPWPPVSRASG